MIIIDNRSKDRTPEIVKEMIEEGFPIELRTDTTECYRQRESLNELIEEIVQKENPDWIIPLDGDEFLVAKEFVRDAIEKLNPQIPHLIGWKNYIPLKEDNNMEWNVLKRICHRKKSESPQYWKVMIPRAIACNSDISITEGCHGLSRNDEELSIEQEEDIWIAHFPVRSLDQLKNKVINGWSNYRDHPQKKEGRNAHWQSLYEKFMSENPPQEQELTQLALQYLQPGIKNDEPVIFDPVRLDNPSMEQIASELAAAANRFADIAHASSEDGTLPACLIPLYNQWEGMPQKAKLCAETVTVLLLAYYFSPNKKISQGIPEISPIQTLIRDQFLSEKWKASIQEIKIIVEKIDITTFTHECRHRYGSNEILPCFYQIFLSKFNSNAFGWRGVYYTPQPVADFLVQYVHKLLQSEFGLAEGLLDDRVRVDDIACGTQILIRTAMRITLETRKQSSHVYTMTDVIRKHILPHFRGWELLPIPPIIGKLQTTHLFERYNCTLSQSENLPCTITNVLEEPSVLSELQEEDTLRAILCNPPFNQFSNTQIKSESDLAEMYKRYFGSVRKNGIDLHPLLDEYVKFIALIHSELIKEEKGIAAIISRNNFLNSYAHKDMRRALFADLNQIYILNLHGSPKDRIQDKRGEDDENVFDTNLGICLIFFIKDSLATRSIRYTDLWGPRKDKFSFLETANFDHIPWIELQPQDPFFLFVPENDQQYQLPFKMDKESHFVA